MRPIFITTKANNDNNGGDVWTDDTVVIGGRK